MSEATVIVHWPGKDTPACDQHAKKLAGLARFMGFPVSETAIEPGLMCANCANEAQKASKP